MKKTIDETERLPPTPSTLKMLFAYSGNQCAVENCTRYLVDDGGTMLGKVAHIHAVKSGANRFDANMTDEQRRAFENLIVVCGDHHDVIDDKSREAEFPAELLKLWKQKHEARFRRAERELINRYKDKTADAYPTFPKHLRALALALNDDYLFEEEESIRGIKNFIEKLSGLPLETRGFAMQLARRMRRLDVDMLLVADIKKSFEIDERELKDLINVLDAHGIGYAHEDWDGNWNVKISDRNPAGNPFIEIIQFCEVTGVPEDSLIYDLNFALYD